jgi:hypothetical protein
MLQTPGMGCVDPWSGGIGSKMITKYRTPVLERVRLRWDPGYYATGEKSRKQQVAMLAWNLGPCPAWQAG